MKYNPENELTEAEISKLGEDDFFEYIDSKAKYLKQFTRPLDTYHAKTFAALTNGGDISAEELKTAKDIGRKGDEAKWQEIQSMANKLGGNPLEKDDKIKVKKHRNQWV